MADEEIKSEKVSLTEDQKEHARSALVMAGIIAPRLKKVRIPKRFEDISLMWVKQAPFFSEFMLRFHFYETKDIPTAGVNCIRGNLNFYFNPQFIDGGGERPEIGKDGHPVFITDTQGAPVLDAKGKIQYNMVPHEALSTSELEGLLIHEIQHIVRLHHERSLEDHQLFNIAADMLINDDVKHMKINGRDLSLPEGGVYLEMATKPTQRPGMPKIEPYKGEKVTEPLYLWLMDVRQQFQDAMQDMLKNSPQSGQGQGGGQPQKCDSCGGDGKEKDEQGNGTGQPCPDCGGSGQQPGPGQGGQQGTGNDLFDALFGSKIDVHEVMSASDELSEAAIKEIIESAKMRGWGNVSGDAVQRLEELLKPAQIPWRQLLRRAISPLIHDYGPHYESTWGRRNRRNLPLPGLRRLSNKLVIGIDTSGSIGNDEIGQFFAEIEKICRDFSQLVIVQWDTDIKQVNDNYKRGGWKQIKVKGRGGTDVQCIFNWMIENGYKKYSLVNFTDGYFDHSFDHKGISTIWACTTADPHIPHGKNIFIDLKKK